MATKKTGKPKVEKVEKPPISEADALADLKGEPRPDNPTVEPEDYTYQGHDRRP